MNKLRVSYSTKRVDELLQLNERDFRDGSQRGLYQTDKFQKLINAHSLSLEGDLFCRLFIKRNKAFTKIERFRYNKTLTKEDDEIFN